MPITGEAVPTTMISLEPGGWYAAAIDTGIVPASLALDTIEERLRSALQIGSLRFFTSREDVPGEVPAVVRDADADVWTTGQYVGQTPITAPRPEQVIAFEALPTAGVGPPVRPGPGPVAPPGPRPIPTAGTGTGETSTSTLVWVALGVVTLGGGAIALAWYMRRPKTNPRRRRRRRR